MFNVECLKKEMVMESVTGRNYTCEYQLFGNGKKILFAFHGFNNNAGNFSELEPLLRDSHQIISINLFFHGKSSVEEHLVEKGISTEDLSDVFQKLMLKFPSPVYELIGYSLGGRVALKIFELFPSRIKRIYLLAADGLRINRVYTFLTGSQVGRMLFRRAVQNPARLFRLASFFRRTTIINPKKYEFALGNFDTDIKRKKVYNVWMTFRRILPDIKKVASLAKKHGTQIHLFFGKYDTIIPSRLGNKLADYGGNQVKVHILETGHRLLTVEAFRPVAAEIRQ
jgi:pimeloyl-ACP methyl ester carboxylesterase